MLCRNPIWFLKNILFPFLLQIHQFNQYLHLKFPEYTKTYKFFQRLTTVTLQELNNEILLNNEINTEIIFLDEVDSLMTMQINITQYRWKERKSYINYISIDEDSVLILHFVAQRDPRLNKQSQKQ